MVEKADIRGHVEASLRAFDRAGAALFTALAAVETEEFEESVEDLAECSDRLDEAVAEVREALELADRGLETGLIKKGEEELASEHASPYETGELLFENLRRKGRLEGLFLDDEEVWNHFQLAAIVSNPLAGYTRFASFATQVRDHVDGLATDVEAGADADHLLFAGWRAATLYMRTKNLVQMLEYINRDTRSL